MSGTKTHEQQQRILQKREKTQGVETPVDQSLEEARRKPSGPPAAYDNSSGDRSIKRGANQETEHHKERADD